MKIVSVEVFKVRLPFRFAFGHSLASRSSSDNLIVAVRLEDGTRGWGESIPREYVTGETIDGAAATIRDLYAPRLIGADVSRFAAASAALAELFDDLGLRRRPLGASFCAIELAVLDACAKANRARLLDAFGLPAAPSARYGGVVPFGGMKALIAILAFYRLYGFGTVKIKVGGIFDDDLARLRLARRILGSAVTIRVDANCAWDAEQTIRFAELARPLAIASIEQPVPADDLAGLRRLVESIPEEIVVDESLCTVEQAELLAASRACTGFNIRISKVGGLIQSMRMAAIARAHGIACHMGAQVGESGILSAAGRVFSLTTPGLSNCEGSDNAFLLARDLTRENTTVAPGGRVAPLPGHGLGVSVDERVLAGYGCRVHAVGLPAAVPSGRE